MKKKEDIVICFLSNIRSALTCKKAKKYLEEHGIEFEDRHIDRGKPTKEELTEWIRISGKSVKKFFNTSGMKYRELGLKDKLPQMSEEEQTTAGFRRYAGEASAADRRRDGIDGI